MGLAHGEPAHTSTPPPSLHLHAAAGAPVPSDADAGVRVEDALGGGCVGGKRGTPLQGGEENVSEWGGHGGQCWWGARHPTAFRQGGWCRVQQMSGQKGEVPDSTRPGMKEAQSSCVVVASPSPYGLKSGRPFPLPRPPPRPCRPESLRSAVGEALPPIYPPLRPCRPAASHQLASIEDGAGKIPLLPP